jgi:hypothetical protein
MSALVKRSVVGGGSRSPSLVTKKTPMLYPSLDSLYIMIYMYIYTSMYVCMYVCMYVYIHTYIHIMGFLGHMSY